jgi:hypothetical protein
MGFVAESNCHKPDPTSPSAREFRFMWYLIRITVRCGDRTHSISVSKRTFAEIRAGREITLQGDGYVTEKGIVSDYWEFNGDNFGSVRVYCDNGKQLYRGDNWLSAERV